MRPIVGEGKKRTGAIATAGMTILVIAPMALVDGPSPIRHVFLEIYVRSGEPESDAVCQVVSRILERRRGVFLRVQDLNGPRGAELQRRLDQIARYYAIESSRWPIIYGCNSVITEKNDASRLASRLEELLRIDVYAREGCPHCRDAKAYLQRLPGMYPGFEIRIRDIGQDAQARQELSRLVQKHRQAAASVPVFHLCNQLIVGFDSPDTTGKRIEAVLNHWTQPARNPPPPRESRAETGGPSPRCQRLRAGLIPWPLTPHATVVPAEFPPVDTEVEPPFLPLPDGSLPGEEHPREDHPLNNSDADLPPPPSPEFHPEPQEIDLPLFGRLQAGKVGMPLFTLAVGLVDGCNPCAMWVLLFLLSILVNVHGRSRILAVAGTFVLISGLAYFLFMAAWMNVFLLIGLLRPVQITLALIAILIGGVHIKDFFAFKQGISLSIPESAKPGIYARVRRIVTAENMSGAILGAVVLAVLVNLVELLCTAGLPAMYTAILAMQEYPVWKNYAYLLLYNAAYMLDDAAMVMLVVVTLGQRKMQERHGRWLKLISGTAIALLGLVMLFRPQWLN